MITTQRFADTSVTWVDGVTPYRYTLERLLSPKYLCKMGLDAHIPKLTWKRRMMSTIEERDECYRSLFASDLEVRLRDLGINSGSIRIFYCVPPFRRPSYASIRKSVVDDTFSPDDLQLLQYGPEKVLHAHRRNRYRQIIGLTPGEDTLSDYFLESLDNTHFIVTEGGNDRGTWGSTDLFREEARFLSEQIVSADRTGRLQDYITSLEAWPGFEIHQIQLPAGDGHI